MEGEKGRRGERGKGSSGGMVRDLDVYPITP